MMVWPDSSSVFLGQTVQGDAHLFLVGLGFRLDRLGDHRLREEHALENDHLVRVAQRVAGRDVLQADRRRDVTGVHFLDFLADVRMHLQ